MSVSIHERIIETVDFICRDSVDMQYMIIQKLSQNLKNSKVRSLYNMCIIHLQL